MKKQHFLSFSTKIILIVLLSLLVPLTVTLSLCYATYHSMVINEVKSVSKQQVDFLSNYTYDFFASAKLSLTTWQNDHQIREFLSADNYTAETENNICTSLSQLCINQTNFANAYLYCPKQEHLYRAFSETKQISYQDIAESEWLSSISASSDFCVSLYPFGKDNSIACAVPIRDLFSNRFLGYSMGKLSARFFHNAFALCDYSYGELYCVTQNGDILYSTEPTSSFAFEPSYLEYPGSYQTIDGNILYCRFIPRSDFYIVSVSPDSIWNIASTTPFYVGLFVSIICIFLSLICAVLLIKHFLHPIRLLADAMSSSDPDHLKPVTLTNSQDEISILEEKYNDMIIRINDMIETQYRSNLAINEARLRALQLQINPHFVNNTLQMIASLAAERNMMDIYSLLCAFSRMFYYCLKFKKNTVLLSGEMTYLEDYIKIQNGRFPDRFTFVSSIEESTYSLELPKMSLQPLIENSFAHAFTDMDKPWIISIESHDYKDFFEITIADNGCGMDKHTLIELQRKLNEINTENLFPTSTNIGLRNVNARIRLLYGKEYGLRIESQKMTGTRITITLPAKKGGELHD